MGDRIKDKCNALFISDTHAFHPLNGALHKQAKILHHSDPDILHLVGDIVDWEAIVHVLKAEFGLKPHEMPEDFDRLYEILVKKWPYFEVHLRFVDLIFEKIAQGKKIFMEPGNHDENMDDFDGQNVLGIEIQKEMIYRSSSGESYLTMHGHRVDPGWLQRNSDWYKRGSRLLDIALAADITLDRNLKYVGNNTKEIRAWLKNMLRRGEGIADELLRKQFREVCENFPIANSLKAIGKIYVRQFESRAVSRAQALKTDGVICGHIHKSRREKKKKQGGVIYLNSGDGLTHATALAHHAGLSDNPLEQWQIIKASTLKTDWEIAKIVVDKAIRRQTIEFMEVSWGACLQKLKEEAQAPVLSVGLKKPQELAA